jgi:hypothetical protein
MTTTQKLSDRAGLRRALQEKREREEAQKREGQR